MPNQSNTTPSATADREIIIKRVVSAPRELVWEVWTNPKHVAQWWGPRGFSTTIEKMDVRPAGEWIHLMRGPDGAEYPNHGVFKEVVKPEHIVYLHGGKPKGHTPVSAWSTWTFIEQNGKTEVTIHMVFESPEKRDQVVKEYGAIEGGKQTLARLDEYLQKYSG